MTQELHTLMVTIFQKVKLRCLFGTVALYWEMQYLTPRGHLRERYFGLMIISIVYIGL